MLFDFHKQQNSKKPGSVHAVHLVCGLAAGSSSAVSTQDVQADGEDAHMQSSPFMSSSMPQKDDNDEEPPAVRSIAICREEDLEGANVLHALVSSTSEVGCGRLTSYLQTSKPDSTK